MIFSEWYIVIGAKATGPAKITEYRIDYSTSHLPTLARCLSGGSEKWLAEGHDFSVIDPEYPEETYLA